MTNFGGLVRKQILQVFLNIKSENLKRWQTECDSYHCNRLVKTRVRAYTIVASGVVSKLSQLPLKREYSLLKQTDPWFSRMPTIALLNNKSVGNSIIQALYLWHYFNDRNNPTSLNRASGFIGNGKTGKEKHTESQNRKKKRNKNKQNKIKQNKQKTKKIALRRKPHAKPTKLIHFHITVIKTLIDPIKMTAGVKRGFKTMWDPWRQKLPLRSKRSRKPTRRKR